MRAGPDIQAKPVAAVQILLLEDDPIFARLVLDSLRRQAWAELELDWASTLKEALEKLERASFDLVISDLRLPDSKGLETIDALARASDRLVIALTGERGPDLREQALRHGAYDLVSKDSLDQAEFGRLVRLAAMQAGTFRSLRESEARKAAILDSSMDAVISMDHRGLVVEFNSAAERQFGYRRDDAIGHDMAELIVPPHLREAHRKGLSRLLATGEQRVLGERLEVPAMRADGTCFDSELAIVRIPGSNPPLYTGTLRDITERKRAGDALKDSEQRFRRLTELSSDMYWEQDANYQFTAISDHGPAHLKSGRGAVIGTRRWDRDYFNMTPAAWAVHRADLDARRSFRDLELGRTNADGAQVWISVSGEPTFDGAGRFTGYRGVARDITTRKRAEEALRLAEANYRSIFENSVDGIYRVDARGRVVTANAALARMLGYASFEEMKTGIASVAHDVYLDPNARREYRQLLQKDGVVSGFEAQWRRRDGSAMWVSMSGRLLRDPSSGESYHLGTAEDISERKRSAQLRELEHAVIRVLAQAETVTDLLQGAIQAVCKSERWECGRYFRVDAEAGMLRLALAWGIDDAAIQRYVAASRDLTYSAGRGLAGRAWQDGEPLWVPDIASDPRVAQGAIALDAGMHCAFVFPVVSEGETLGVLAFNSREVRQRDDELLGAIRVIGSQIGQFLRIKQAGVALRESEARFRSLNELSSDFYWETDAQHRIVRNMRGVQEETPADGRAPVGMTRWEVPSTRPDAAGWAAHRATVEAHQPFRDFELARLDASGVERHVALSGEPIFDATGNFTGYRGVGKDITARKREERLLELEHSVAQALARARSEAEGVEAVMAAICISENWECGRYFAVDANASVIRFRQGWTAGEGVMREFAESSRGVEFTRGRGLVGEVWESGKALWVPDVNLDTRVSLKALAEAAGLHGAFLLPVLIDSEVAGVLSMSSRKVRKPDERLLRSVKLVAEHLGQFLQRKRADEALRRQSVRLSDLVALQGRLADGQLDLKGMCKGLVETTRQIIGTGAAALQFVEGEQFLYFDATEGAKHLVGVRTSLKGNFSSAVLESGGAIRCDDTQTDPRINAEAARRAGARSLIGAPLQHEGRVVGVLKLISDMPHAFDDEQVHMLQVLAGIGGAAIRRKQVETALMESEARFRMTFEHAASGIAHVSLDGVYLQANRRLCAILGYSEADLIGRSVKGLSHPDDRNVMDGRLAQLRTGEVASVRGEKRYLRKDGSVVWVELTIACARDASGNPHHDISIFEDVTERKASEDALRRFRAALDSSADMVFLIDMRDGRLLDFNDTACAYLGYERAELLTRTADQLLCDLDASQLRTSYTDLLDHPGRADSVVRRYRRKDGRAFDTEVLRRVIDSPDGPILVVNARDLTERNLLEARQAVYVRHQEEMARFGASALERRNPASLVDDAVQSALEGLRAEAVVYLEREADGRVFAKGFAGLDAPDEATLDAADVSDALALVLDHGESSIVDAPAAALPFKWAGAFASALLVPVHGEDRIKGALCALSAGAGDLGQEEAKFLVTTASVLSAGLRRIESEGRLAFLAQFDVLTGLPNRALLSDRFSQMIVQARRHSTQLGVLFIDLDHFKLINDTLGHAGGDELLKETGRRLQSAVRPGDTVARISGDEFAVILGDLARAEDGALVAQKIIDRLGAPLQLGGQEVFVSASVGIACFPADGDDAEALLGAADAAMYRAKQSGRSTFQFFTAEINQRTRARAQLGSELRRALEREEFQLAYQPKFDLRTGHACAVEALLRWQRPGGGMVSPAEFIPVLEETGLIVPVGEWVLKRACLDLKVWQEAGMRELPVAVNLSARQFRQQDLDGRIRAIIEASGVDPALIELEITESQLMHDPEHAIRTVQALSDAGIRIAIDDFGTGYSSLSYLTRFAVSSLKIDRSFVADVLIDQADAAIVRTIVDMAHTLGFTVVAEGVETEGQAAFLRGLGCEQAQGYLFARPMPAGDLQKLIGTGRARRGAKVRSIARRPQR